MTEGKRIARLSDNLTREQLQELFAIAQTQTALGKWGTKIMSSHFKKSPCGALLARALIDIQPRKLGPRTHHRQKLTRLGWLVLLRTVEIELPSLSPAYEDHPF
jgi:hypothetical protein